MEQKNNKKVLYLIGFLAILIGGWFLFGLIKKGPTTESQAIDEAKKFKPKGMCTAVMTPAIHKKTGAKFTFSSGCLPEGWEGINK